jgi:uncharacterized membrane protein
MALAGILWGISRGPRLAVVTCGAAATAVAMITPIVRSARWVDVLPLWIQWNLRPFGDSTTFTLLPWAGFLLAGAAYGAVLSLARDDQTERRLLSGLTLAAAATLVVGFYTASKPTIYHASNFWTSSPTYFAVRTGILMLTLSAFFAVSAIERWLPRTLYVLERFGRNSLFIYWIHVELVYGYTTWIMHRRLPLWGTATAYVLFCGVMYLAIVARDRLVERRRARRPRKSAPTEPAAAQA